MVAAMPEAIFHPRAFEEFDTHLRRDMPEQVADWDQKYAEWDRKPKSSPCLFDITERRKYLFMFHFLCSSVLLYSCLDGSDKATAGK